MANWTEGLTWLAAGEPNNPFPTEVLDCRAASAALGLVSSEQLKLAGVDALLDEASQSSALPAIADAFDAACALRISLLDCTGREKPFPAAVRQTWRLELTPASIVARRNRTSQVVHIAQYEAIADYLIVKRVASQRDLTYQNSDYAIAELEFLLRTYLEGSLHAFPIAPGFERDDMKKIALSGWKRHGPAANFARFF